MAILMLNVMTVKGLGNMLLNVKMSLILLRRS